mgnify:CR=1 FL=1
MSLTKPDGTPDYKVADLSLAEFGRDDAVDQLLVGVSRFVAIRVPRGMDFRHAPECAGSRRPSITPLE